MFKRRYLELVLAAAAALLAVFAMGPSASNGFVWDDVIYIEQNPAITDLSARGVKNIFSQVHYGLYKPVTMLSLAVNHHFSGGNPRAYHITNIVLHAVNAGLVLWLVLLLGQNRWAAFLCAALFAVHPMHVESVAWACERKDMLYALFFLLSSILYLRFTVTRARWLMAGAILCFLLSLGSKPMGITLPVVLFIYDYLLGRKFSGAIITEKAWFFAAALGFGAGTLFMLQSAGQIKGGFTLFDRVLFVFYGLKFYILKLLWPTGLSAMYPFPVKSGGQLPLEFWLSPITVTGCLLLMVVYCRNNRLVMAAAAFYVVTVFPALQFVGVGPVIAADRYSYIPALGLFLPAAVYAVKGITVLLERRKALAWLAMGGVAILLVAMTAASRARCAVWQDNYTLFADASAKYPVPAILNRFAVSVMNRTGRPEDALAVFEYAIKVSSPLWRGASNFADVMASYEGIAAVLNIKGQRETAARIFHDVNKNFRLTCRGGLVYADLLVSQGKYDEAMKYLRPLFLIPDSAASAYELAGDIYVKTGDAAAARAAHDKARDLRGAGADISAEKEPDLCSHGRCLSGGIAVGYFGGQPRVRRGVEKQ